MSAERDADRAREEWERLLVIERQHARERAATADLLAAARERAADIEREAELGVIRSEAWPPGAVMRSVTLPEEVLYRFRRIERAAQRAVRDLPHGGLAMQDLRLTLDVPVHAIKGPPSEPVGMRDRPKSHPCIQVAGDWLMERPVGEAINDLLALMRARPEAALAAIAAFEFDETGETLR